MFPAFLLIKSAPVMYRTVDKLNSSINKVVYSLKLDATSGFPYLSLGVNRLSIQI